MSEEWLKIHIGDILDFKNGLNKGKIYFGHGTPIVNYTDVYNNNGLRAKDIKGLVELSREEIHRFEVRKNDVFFTRTSETPDEVGLSSVLLEDIPNCVFSGFILRGRPKNDWLLGEYCRYCFSTKRIREEIIRNCTYTTRALTNGKVLSGIEISLPSKPEQKAIAHTLSTFDTYINDLTELIEKKKGIRDGALEDLVSGKTIIDGVKNGWKELELNKIAYYGKDRVDSKKKNYISTENMEQEFLGVRRYKSAELVSGIKFEKMDILMANIRPYLKKIWFADFAGCCSADVLVIKAKENINPRFLYYVLANDRFINYVMSGGIKGIKMPRGDKTYIMNYRLLAPEDMTIQEEISDMLFAMDEEINALVLERDKMIQIREGAMDDLLTGRVRLPM